MRFAIAMLTLAFMAGTVEAKYFEPTEEQSRIEHKAIYAQYQAYKQARAEKNWEKVRELALFHFIIAWSYNNEAVELLAENGAYSNVDLLNKAEQLLTQAISSADAAIQADSYTDQAKDCKAKAESSRKVVRNRLAKLNK